MPIDEEGWEDIDPEAGWEDVEAAPGPWASGFKFGAKPAQPQPPQPRGLAALQGAEIKAEPSWLEKSKGFLAGLGKGTVNLGARALDEVVNFKPGAMPIYNPAADMAKEERIRKIEEMLGTATAPDGQPARPMERTGRAAAGVVPQVALGVASGGQSIPVQAAIAALGQYGQSRLEGMDPGASALGAVPAAGFTLLGGGVSRAMAPAAGARNAAVEGATKYMGFGPEALPASVRTGSKPVQYLEGWASKVPGGGKVTERLVKAEQALVKEGDDTLADWGDPTAREAGGNIIDAVRGLRRYSDEAEGLRKQLGDEAVTATTQAQEKALADAAAKEAAAIQRLTAGADDANTGRRLWGGRKQTHEDWTTVKNALYDKADVSQFDAATKRFDEFADEFLARGDASAEDIAAIKALRQRLAPGVRGEKGIYGEVTESIAPPRASDLLREIRTLGKRRGNDPVVFKSEALRRKVADMLDQDLYESLAASGSDAGTRLKQAQEFYRKGIEINNSEVARKISSLGQKGNYSEIVGDLVNPNMAAEDIPRILAMAPDAKPGIQASVMQDILRRSSSGGRVDPKRLATALSRWDDKLDSILEPDQIKELADLASQQKPVVNPLTPRPVFANEPPSAARALEGTQGRLIGRAQPSTVVADIVKPGMATEDIGRALAVAGDSADEIRASVWQRIMDKASSGTGEARRITPQGIARQIGSGPGQWTREQLKLILGDDGLSDLLDMSTVSEGMADANRILRSSPTAGLQQFAMPGVALGAGAAGSYQQGDLKPLLAALAAIGARYGAAKGIGSDLGQKWLTSGLPGAGGAGQAVSLTGRAGTAGLMSDVANERRLYEARRGSKR
jgi:uncharacterized membrane protein